MPGQFWTAAEQKHITELWKNRPPTISVREFAREHHNYFKRTPDAIAEKIKSLPEYRVPSSNRTPWDTQPKLEGDAFVLMDAQIPFHHAEFINKCLALCRRWNIKQIILGGDAIDLHALAQFAPNFENDNRRVIDTSSADALLKFAETLPAAKREEMLNIIGDAERENGAGQEIKECRQILKAIGNEFDKAVWIMGNHEQRILRTLQTVLPVDTLAALFGTDTPKWTVSPYYWCELESGGEKWQIEHPINTTKHSSKRLAPKFGCHIVMGHNHHFSITTDPSGKYYAIEPGMAMDEERMAYAVQRHNTADAHVLGALIIRNGKPTPLNKFTDWDMLK